MKVSDLSPSPYNPRKISNQKLTRLKKSLLEFGDLSGIVFNVSTGLLVGGYQRIKSLDPTWAIEKAPHQDQNGTVAVGHIETPFGRFSYREVEWSEKKEKAANLAANKHGGEFDLPMVKETLLDLDTGAFDLELTGFSEGELKELIDWQGGLSESGGSGGGGAKTVSCPECGCEFKPS